MTDTQTANSATARHDPAIAERTLIIERVFKASPEKVFKAWTDPAILVKWWGPEGFETPDLKMDVRQGGAYRTVMLSPKGDSHVASGVYREIAPPRRLVMTWAWEKPDGTRGHETEIVLTFEPAPGGTKMRMVQKLFQDGADRDGHNSGWASSFNDLERLFP
jgi:uncharacterized protein YndB with AHSA1/START domain